MSREDAWLNTFNFNLTAGDNAADTAGSVNNTASAVAVSVHDTVASLGRPETARLKEVLLREWIRPIYPEKPITVVARDSDTSANSMQTLRTAEDTDSTSSPQQEALLDDKPDEEQVDLPAPEPIAYLFKPTGTELDHGQLQLLIDRCIERGIPYHEETTFSSVKRALSKLASKDALSAIFYLFYNGIVQSNAVIPFVIACFDPEFSPNDSVQNALLSYVPFVALTIAWQRFTFDLFALNLDKDKQEIDQIRLDMLLDKIDEVKKFAGILGLPVPNDADVDKTEVEALQTYYLSLPRKARDMLEALIKPSVQSRAFQGYTGWAMAATTALSDIVFAWFAFATLHMAVRIAAAMFFLTADLGDATNQLALRQDSLNVHDYDARRRLYPEMENAFGLGFMQTFGTRPFALYYRSFAPAIVPLVRFAAAMDSVPLEKLPLAVSYGLRGIFLLASTLYGTMLSTVGDNTFKAILGDAQLTDGAKRIGLVVQQPVILGALLWHVLCNVFGVDHKIGVGVSAGVAALFAAGFSLSTRFTHAFGEQVMQLRGVKDFYYHLGRVDWKDKLVAGLGVGALVYPGIANEKSSPLIALSAVSLVMSFQLLASCMVNISFKWGSFANFATGAVATYKAVIFNEISKMTRAFLPENDRPKHVDLAYFQQFKAPHADAVNVGNALTLFTFSVATFVARGDFTAMIEEMRLKNPNEDPIPSVLGRIWEASCSAIASCADSTATKVSGCAENTAAKARDCCASIGERYRLWRDGSDANETTPVVDGLLNDDGGAGTYRTMRDGV